ncbi:MAG: lipocalin family protein, partial [Bacteroidia bacterium]
MLYNRKALNSICFAMIAFFTLACSGYKDLQVVKKVELEKYSGTWYEIARFSSSFEKSLKCVTATYTLKDNGKIEVRNKGYKI